MEPSIVMPEEDIHESAIIDLQSDTDEEEDAESLSDLSSHCSSASHMTSVTDLSIYHEFDALLGELYTIQDEQDRAIEHLRELQQMITSDNEQVMVYDEEIDDLVEFNEIIERLHQKSMMAIETSSGGHSFTEELLSWIDRISSED
jgi:hypothetical protein